MHSTYMHTHSDAGHPVTANPARLQALREHLAMATAAFEAAGGVIQTLPIRVGLIKTPYRIDCPERRACKIAARARAARLRGVAAHESAPK